MSRTNPAASASAKRDQNHGASGGVAKTYEQGAGVRVIRKYPNRRLYDTQTSSYVSMAALKDMVLRFEAFTVIDSATGEDITRGLLLQVLLEQESAGVPLFNEATLANLIRLYGHAHRGVLGQWLERSTLAFGRHPFDVAAPADMLKPWVNQQKELVAGLQAGWAEQMGSVFGAMLSGGTDKVQSARNDQDARQSDARPAKPSAKRRRDAP